MGNTMICGYSHAFLLVVALVALLLFVAVWRVKGDEEGRGRAGWLDRLVQMF